MTMAALQAAVEALARSLPGRLACLVCSGPGEEWVAHRAEEEFVMASVIKVPIAIATAAVGAALSSCTMKSMAQDSRCC